MPSGRPPSGVRVPWRVPSWPVPSWPACGSEPLAVVGLLRVTDWPVADRWVAAASEDHRAIHSSMTCHVVRRAARPVSMPRWPPGTTSSAPPQHPPATGRLPGLRDRRDPVGGAGEHEHRRGDVLAARSSGRRSRCCRARVRCPSGGGGRAARTCARVGDHVGREAVHRLELREEVHVVEVGRDRQRPGDQLLERGELEGPPDQRLGAPPIAW